jgi:hypothetical protein
MTSGSDWLSYHVFFTRDRHRVLMEFVLPLVRSLYAACDVESFFFIHYPEGGLHVRLRLLPVAGRRESVVARFSAASAPFLGGPGAPVAPVDGEGAADAFRLKVVEVPFEPETERYGGEEFLAHSLEFFCVSSVVALEFASSHGRRPRASQLSQAFRILSEQALGLADGVQEFLALAGYLSFRWEGELGELAVRGDRVFAQRRDALCAAIGALMRSFSQTSRSGTAGANPDFSYPDAAGLLCSATRTAGDVARRNLGISQMHMTANRLALDNREEIYLARLLWLSASAVAEADPKLWNDLETRYRTRPSTPISRGEVAAFWPVVRRQFLGRLIGLGDVTDEVLGSAGRGA